MNYFIVILFLSGAQFFEILSVQGRRQMNSSADSYRTDRSDLGSTEKQQSSKINVLADLLKPVTVNQPVASNSQKIRLKPLSVPSKIPSSSKVMPIGLDMSEVVVTHGTATGRTASTAVSSQSSSYHSDRITYVDGRYVQQKKSKSISRDNTSGLARESTSISTIVLAPEQSDSRQMRKKDKILDRAFDKSLPVTLSRAKKSEKVQENSMTQEKSDSVFLDRLKKLLSAGSRTDKNAVHDRLYGLLKKLVVEENYDDVLAMIESGAIKNLNTRINLIDDKTLLFVLVMLHADPRYVAHQDVLKLIVMKAVKKGADVNVLDNNHRTPLYYAVKDSDLDMVQFLVKSGADKQLGKYGKDALAISFEILDNLKPSEKIFEVLEQLQSSSQPFDVDRVLQSVQKEVDFKKYEKALSVAVYLQQVEKTLYQRVFGSSVDSFDVAQRYHERSIENYQKIVAKGNEKLADQKIAQDIHATIAEDFGCGLFGCM